MPTREIDVVRHALSVARSKGWAEVEVSGDGWEFAGRLENAKPAAPKPAAVAASAEAPAKAAPVIKSTLVGYFTFGKKPLKAGDEVQVGQVVGVITALGIASDLESKVAGIIGEVLVEEGQPVEYGQPIARFREAE